jgi:hypothetical protein
MRSGTDHGVKVTVRQPSANNTPDIRDARDTSDIRNIESLVHAPPGSGQTA